MRHIAVVAAAAVIFAMVAPAFAQPFADVPTNHWAYDAIAELAAKGLVEGYPDGTFKGDRAMTRYEMAMVVARLLARIESIQIPAPAPAPQVTKADLDALQRLINEFRAELAALGVRVTAIEEELNAIKAKLDNVRITGRARFRYDGAPSCTGGPVNFNLNTCGNGLLGGAAAGSPQEFRARAGLKLMFDGSVAPDIHAIIGLELANGVTSTPLTFNGSGFGVGVGTTATSSPNYSLQNVAEMYLDWNHAWGLPLRIQIGRMGGLQQGFGMFPLQFGPYGLLVNTTSDTYGASTGNNGAHFVDGLRLSGNLPSWADLNWQVAAWRVTGPTGGGSYFMGEDAYGIDANFRIIPGVRVGGYYVTNQITNPAGWAASTFPTNTVFGPAFTGVGLAPQWHVYGNPSTPGTNPSTFFSSGGHCVITPTAGTIPATSGSATSQGGISCPALGSGYGAYVGWDIVPGIHLDGEYASWNDGLFNNSDNAYWVGVNFDIGALTGIGHNAKVLISYEHAGLNFYPPYGNDVDADITGSVFPGNANLLLVDLSFDLTDQWGVSAAYYTGNNQNGDTLGIPGACGACSITEWRAGVTYRFAPGASLYTRIEQQQIGGVTQYILYRSELNYTF